jgi:hypothetical protein
MNSPDEQTHKRPHVHMLLHCVSGETTAPLLVNTPGWVKGLGLSMLQDLIVRANPSHVITIDGLSVHKNLPSGAFWDTAASSDSRLTQRISLRSHSQSALMHTPPGPRHAEASLERRGESQLQGEPEPQRRSSIELRTARMHAWVCEVLAANDTGMTPGRQLARIFSGDLRASASELCSCRPVSIDLEDVVVVPLLIKVPSMALAAALNGSLVSLCTVSTSSADRQPTLDEIQV